MKKRLTILTRNCRRLKTVAKSAKDNFRATADRCAIIRDSIGQAEEDVRALNVQLVQSWYVA